MLGVTDVFIIGGRPAGLAMAIAARQRGFGVVVADGQAPPIDKACGEGLLPEGALSSGLESGPLGSPSPIGLKLGVSWVLIGGFPCEAGSRACARTQPHATRSFARGKTPLPGSGHRGWSPQKTACRKHSSDIRDKRHDCLRLSGERGRNRIRAGT